MQFDIWNLRAVKAMVAVAAAMLAALWTPAAVAQGDANWQKIVAAAKQEGSVFVYYQTVAPLMDRVIKDFRRCIRTSRSDPRDRCNPRNTWR